MNYKLIFSLLGFMAVAVISFGQGVTITSDSLHIADSSAILDLFTTERGFLLPRLTSTQIVLIEDPADGLVVYNISDGKVYVYRDLSSNWTAIDLGTATLTPFTCGNNWNDTRDGKSYSTVLINGRCWFAQNINVGTMVTNTTSGQSNNQVIEKFCYSNNEGNCTNFGGLYYYSEAMNYNVVEGGQGICPDGWYVPTDLEWHYMENFLDATVNNMNVIGWRGTDCGGKMKVTGTTYWNSPNTGATNSSGFSARGGGNEFYLSFLSQHLFSNVYQYGYFWTSSDTSSFFPVIFYGPLTRYLAYNSQQSGRSYDDHFQGNQSAYSLRCIKDE